MPMLEKFHGYLGRLVVLRGTQSRTAKIVGGDGLELFGQYGVHQFLSRGLAIASGQ